MFYHIFLKAEASDYEVHCCALDVSKAFDSASHAQVVFSLVSSGATFLFFGFFSFGIVIQMFG